MVEKFLIDSNSFMTPYRQYFVFDFGSGLLERIERQVCKSQTKKYIHKKESFIIQNVKDPLS